MSNNTTIFTLQINLQRHYGSHCSTLTGSYVYNSRICYKDSITSWSHLYSVEGEGSIPKACKKTIYEYFYRAKIPTGYFILLYHKNIPAECITR
ncbi:MAG: hypothetical protein LC107_05730 [Chitinophagales bacterium]|nr:hypothetical protein [Chitinophagales bacterium]